MMSFILSFTAGALTTLSPCVLPVLPLVMGGALRKRRTGPVLMALGMITSFVLVGWSVAAFGSFFGLEGSSVRTAAAILLGVFGVVLLSQTLQERFSNLLSPVAKAASQISSHRFFDEGVGLFFLGVLLGALWSPCSGPTLGIAITLAAQSGGGFQSAALLLIFGIGACIPLLLIAYGAQGIFNRYKGHFVQAAGIGKKIFGVIIILVSLGIMSGADRKLEGWLLQRLPDSLVDFTTQF